MDRTTKRDDYIAEGKWDFNREVSEVFDDMVERSIPDYHSMRDLTCRLARRFIKARSRILDVGCSTGLASLPMIREFGGLCQFFLCDVSEPMLAVCRERFSKEVERGNVEVFHDNLLGDGLRYDSMDVVISCLTLQFIPIEHRQKAFENIYNALEPGGAFLIVEKVIGNTSTIDGAFVEEYHDLKRDNEYTQEQIASKRKSLEGILVPLTSSMNETMLRQAGFSKIDCFWRYLNFAGFIAIK